MDDPLVGHVTGTAGCERFAREHYAWLAERAATLEPVRTTLAIAALFAPVRGRVQNFVDGRFYRRKDDTAQTLAAFAALARDEVDLDQLSDDLHGAVDAAMQPAHMDLWLRPEAKAKPPDY